MEQLVVVGWRRTEDEGSKLGEVGLTDTVVYPRAVMVSQPDAAATVVAVERSGRLGRRTFHAVPSRSRR